MGGRGRACVPLCQDESGRRAWMGPASPAAAWKTIQIRWPPRNVCRCLHTWTATLVSAILTQSKLSACPPTWKSFCWRMRALPPLGKWSRKQWNSERLKYYPELHNLLSERIKIMNMGRLTLKTVILKNLFFNWRIIASQNFVVFCQPSTWLSHRFTCVPSLLKPPPISLPSRLVQSPWLSFLSHTAHSCWLSTLHMVT